MNKELWYSAPAESFKEALPLGNGSLGAMVYGRVPNEHITLNLDTFWSGTGRREDKVIPPQDLAHVRALIFNQQYWEAEQYIKKHMLGHYNESYMPLGHLDYTFIDICEYSNYKRTLNLEDSVLTTEFTANGSVYETEMFISYVDHLLAIQINSDQPASVNLKIALTSLVRFQTDGDEDLWIYGTAPSQVQPNYVVCDEPVKYDAGNPGMPFCGYLRIGHTDGQVCRTADSLYIKGASSVTMYVTANVGYEGFGKLINPSVEECVRSCVKILDHALDATYMSLKKNHIQDYQGVFKDFSLEMGEEYTNLSTDARLKRFDAGEDDIGLYALFLHYDRYLLISSSRNGAQPANLQGIWSDSLRPVWSSNWTININTQMNYWPAGPCNLMDCYEPLLSMLEELSVAGIQTAQNQYQCRGWAANHNVDIWRQTGPVAGEPKYAYWPMGGVWLSAQIYDYYKYTLDIETLRNRIYPVMKGSVEFCLDWLVYRSDGKYYTLPSTSPENTFLDNKGRKCGVSYASTMDVGIIKELLQNYMEASKVLGVDDLVLKSAKEHFDKLPEFQIGKYGQLQEWILDFNEVDPGHRHFSPVFGFHPGNTIQKGRDMELIAACEKVLERRSANHRSQIGWSCSWLVNLWAKLGNGDKALYYLSCLLKNSVYDNLFDLHPPLGESAGEREVFQIDGNFGGASGIAGMFLESSNGKIELLPALPSTWKKGCIKGLLAEGNITVDISWNEGKLEEAVLFTPISQKAEVYGPGFDFIQEIDLRKNEKYFFRMPD